MSYNVFAIIGKTLKKKKSVIVNFSKALNNNLLKS